MSVNKPQVNPPDSWAFFDKIYCISLLNRADRREQARQQFAKVGLLARVEFVVMAKHPDNPEHGIFISHMHCLQKGLDAGAENILVFEDDVVFQRYTPGLIPAVTHALQLLADWNALFLGGITSGSQKTGHKNLVRVTYRCLAHAYALNRLFAQEIAQLTWSDIPFDEVLRRHNRDFYAVYPMCAFQGPASSDNKTVAIDRIRRICGGLLFIQTINEFYQNHRRILQFSLLFLFALAVLALIVW